MSVREETLIARSSSAAPPLVDVMVLELASGMAGPYCGSILRDLGARVIKVERPDEGDVTRTIEGHLNGESGYFHGLNRGKEGLSVDLKNFRGQEVIHRLAETVDIVTANFRPGLAQKFGVDYETLKQVNPRLIYCTVSAYGEAAGYENLAGHDISCQAYSGLMDLTGEAGGPPQRLGAPVIDAATGFASAIGVLGALYRRDRTGEGEHVAVSLIESAFALMPNFLTSVLNSHAEFKRTGTAHQQVAPCETFECGDGRFMSICAFTDRLFHVLCQVIGKPWLSEDARFATNADRLQRRDELHALVREALQARPREEWIPLLEERGLSPAPVFSLRESLDVFSNAIPSFANDVTHPTLGTLRMTRPPYRFTERPLPPVTRPGPSLGGDTDRVLAEFGFPPEDIDQLRSEGVITQT